MNEGNWWHILLAQYDLEVQQYFDLLGTNRKLPKNQQLFVRVLPVERKRSNYQFFVLGLKIITFGMLSGSSWLLRRRSILAKL